jgi:hypothetical protein
MAGDVDAPRIWTGADVYVAPVGSTAPTDTTTALDAAFKALGLLSDDAASEARSEDSTDHYAWGGILVRTTRSKHKRTIKVTALEDNDTVYKLVNPGSTSATATGTTTRVVKVPTTDPRAFVLQLNDGDTILRRHIAKGEVVEVGDVTLSETDMTAYELTINVYPAADGTLYTDITDSATAAVTP